MARWRRWSFRSQGPSDDFLRHLQRGLVVRGVHVHEAEHFDLEAKAFGARAYLTLSWDDQGVVLTAKFKTGFFGTPAALEKLLLESAREAEARVARRGETV